MLKKVSSYVISVCFLSLMLAFAGWEIVAQTQTPFHFLSPLPDFLTLSKNNQVKQLDLWFPEKGYAQTSPASITAKSVLMYDLTENKVLFERNSHARMPMASLTKIMTAIITLENPQPQSRYVVHGENLVGEDSMGLNSGEVLSQEELLYGLMLNSGNDAAEVLASNYSSGRAAFIQAMNNKAEAMGLTDTHFSNPSGLQGDGTQYTTAADLLVITKFALDSYPLFGKIVATYEEDVPETTTHKAYTLYNETNLLTTYPGVKGVKTGYTPEAGMCLVSLLDYQNHKIIGIILNSENRRQEMKELLDYSLIQVGITPPAHE